LEALYAGKLKFNSFFIILLTLTGYIIDISLATTGFNAILGYRFAKAT
jgi:hypothetical protein